MPRTVGRRITPRTDKDHAEGAEAQDLAEGGEALDGTEDRRRIVH